MGVEGEEGEGAADERRKADKVCNVGNLEIVKGIFGKRKWEENQDQTNVEDQNDTNVDDLPDSAKDMGINILDNAHNYMIGNLRTTKWFYYELEEIREKISHMERIKDEPRLGCQIDQEKQLKLAERQIQELDNHYQILANHMISILNSMNDNIQTLTRVLEARGCWKRNLERIVRL